MINLNLPEPKIKECVYCFRQDTKQASLRGILVHFPNENSPDTYEGFWGKMESFSTWFYTCKWCRGIETKRKEREKLLWKKQI